MNGSSPLTRGKRQAHLPGARASGLIPAHAGKTTRAACRPPGIRAHPRSRGENRALTRLFVKDGGSSPLTRGKRVSCSEYCGELGLIPAHAGKTRPPLMHAPTIQAHPRSRGENCGITSTRGRPRGSSPLTRGKRSGVSRSRLMRGLIPAHAGKTAPANMPLLANWAHPRSRGENFPIEERAPPMCGSSPLTRGKRDPSPSTRFPRGLIPAHAGKTLPDLRFYRADRSDLGKP